MQDEQSQILQSQILRNWLQSIQLQCNYVTSSLKKSKPKFIEKYKMLIEIIKNSRFGYAKTSFQINKKRLNSTLNADLCQGEGYNVKKRCERAGVRLHLTLPLALRG